MIDNELFDEWYDEYQEYLSQFEEDEEEFLFDGEYTLEELVESGVKEVIVRSYGYETKSCYGSHFEPFKAMREFKFSITSHEYKGRLYIFLEHEWLMFDNEESERFIVENGVAYCNDPKLFSR